MCGSVCLWQAGDAALARRMIDKIAHRGPDELQVSQLPGVPAVMAHCRLAIIGPEGRGPHRQRASRAQLHRGRPRRGPAPRRRSSGERRHRSRAQRPADPFSPPRSRAGLDRELIAFAQSIPVSLKIKAGDRPGGAMIEKWILRKACEDLLPPALIWRKKAQFDEGSGTIAALDEALAQASGLTPPIDRCGQLA